VRKRLVGQQGDYERLPVQRADVVGPLVTWNPPFET